MSRDDFSAPVKEALAKRVGLKCSNPSCRSATSGPHTSSMQFVNIGVACHIAAASPGGPRFDKEMTEIQRSSIDNAIWLCQSCAKLVDNDPAKYTVGALIAWKLEAEGRATRELSGEQQVAFYPQPASAMHTPIPRIDDLTYDEARDRLIAAGWQPRRKPWSFAAEPFMQSGNGLHFWQKGYHEITSASGTGLACCTFGFRDVYGTNLVVVTAGEVIEEVNATAGVWNWYFEARDDA